MTPRLVLNYEYYTYIEMILMKSFSHLKVSFARNLRVKSVSTVPPVPPLCPTGRDGTLSPL